MRVIKLDVMSDKKKSVRYVTEEMIHDALLMYAGWDRVKNVEHVEVPEDSKEAGEAVRNSEILKRARKP